MTDGGAVRLPQIRQRLLERQDPLWKEALRIHYNAIVMDGHIDTPTLMLENDYDLSARHREGDSHVDLPRMYDGGLDAPFFSIYVPPKAGHGEDATRYARRMIAEAKRQIAAHPDSAALATTADEVRRITRSGRKAILMGLEGGEALAGSPGVLAELRREGIRYVTLTHIHTTSWADASQDAPRWDGLNDQGRQLVREMNRLGVLVDLSHTSDATFYDALEVTRAPVILSHSSMRALSPNERNADDQMLRAIAKNGGVVMINFFEAMVNQKMNRADIDEVHRRIPGLNRYNLWDVFYEVKRERGYPNATVDDVIDHIDHAVKVAGVDHVGLGSDFDGVFLLPTDLKDVTRLPWLTYGLLKRGYSEQDIYKILGGNTLRVLDAADRVARTMR